MNLSARRRSVVGLGAFLLILGVAAAVPNPAATEAGAGEVLILGPTVSGGASSTLAQKFVAAGKTPVVVSAADWSSMTSADFDRYDALVLGDPTCASLGPEAAATANADVWSPVVDGNVVVIGTDETYHQGQGGASLMEKAAAFTVAKAGRTGAYISLSCYYHNTAALTPVPLLAGLGTFTATGVGCYNNAHIVATHPALDGLTDSTLSGWSCSVHEGFDTWPLSFEVLAIARDIGSAFTAPDGSVGTPYILARGVDVISDIDLSPAEATNDLGTSHTVTATVAGDDPESETDSPVVGTTVTFSVVDGPHKGATATGVTDSAGRATFAYTGTTLGTDLIEATFVDSRERTQRSNRVTKTWVPAEVCGNEIDDNSNGTVDEGCAKAVADEVLPVLFKKDGYLLVGGDGGIFADPIGGSTNFVGAASVNRVPPKLVLPQSLRVPSAQIVGVDIMASLEGYWVAGADGGVYAIGDAPFSGSMGNKTLTAPIVGIAADPDGIGYWLAGADGAVYAFDAPLHGSMFGTKLNAPIVGIAAHPGGGFYLIASDGGVFAFGGAPFSGSLGNIKLDKPIVGLAVDPDGRGYLLGASDGGVFAIDARFAGSVANLTLAAPVVGIVADPDGTGYWLAAEDGGLFALDAPYYGSVAHLVLNRAIVGIAGT